MRMTFWPDSEPHEVDEALAWPPNEAVVLVAERAGGGLCGFAEVEQRKWAEGCASSPVPYLEGIWVDGDCRRDGVAEALVRGAEAWALSLGINELASDCDINNAASIAFHTAVGFEETERVVCFRRSF